MMNLADPELELIDPTPNVHTLFIHFDKEFFWTKLVSRAVVRWSKKMYSCAGICSYDRGGLCDIALSEPLLKLRPRKDLVETLLHEMIHAFLFITNRDQDRDGHGPTFQAHMHRINKLAGLNISIYHSFHDEVHLYQTHWWRCDGPCQTRRPHFGIVRRSMNRVPGPSDYWWNDHKKKCGGTFVKIKEPENYKSKQISNGKSNSDTTKKSGSAKSNGDITKYINNNTKTIDNLSNFNTAGKPVLKDLNINNSNLKTKSNGSSTFVIGKKGVIFNPTGANPQLQIPLFTGSGHTISESKHISDHRSVTEQVRNIWANKEIPTVINKAPIKKLEASMPVKNAGKIAGTSNPNKQKAKNTNIQSPPAKIKKIDDYFKATATSVLKDLYGEDFRLTQKHNSTKLIAVSVNQDLVDCPTCNVKIDSNKINEHLDECLNRDLIKELSQDNKVSCNTPSGSNIGNSNLVQIVRNIPTIPDFKGKQSTTRNIVDLTNLNGINTVGNKINSEKDRRKSDSQTMLQSIEQDKETLIKEIDHETNKTSQILDNKQPVLNKIRKSDNFITKDKGDDIFPLVKTESVSDRAKSEVRPESSINMTNMVPNSSRDSEIIEQICPCCGNKFDKTVDEHLDECLVFSEHNNTISNEGASTSFGDNSTIVINDDDFDDNFDESQELNASGTKTPCPCCMKMVEEIAMNDHLDYCLGLTQP